MASKTIDREIVDAIETELNDRRGFHFDSLDDEVRRELKGKLREIVRGVLARRGIDTPPPAPGAKV